jgi:hypothetical protein
VLETIPLHIEVPGDGYHRGLIACQVACPVKTDARGYVRAIAAVALVLLAAGGLAAQEWKVPAEARGAKNPVEATPREGPVEPGALRAIAGGQEVGGQSVPTWERPLL